MSPADRRKRLHRARNYCDGVSVQSAQCKRPPVNDASHAGSKSGWSNLKRPPIDAERRTRHPEIEGRRILHRHRWVRRNAVLSPNSCIVGHPEVDQPAAGLNGGSSTFTRPLPAKLPPLSRLLPTSGTARHGSPPDDRRACPKAGRWRQQRFPERFGDRSSIARSELH